MQPSITPFSIIMRKTIDERELLDFQHISKLILPKFKIKYNMKAKDYLWQWHNAQSRECKRKMQDRLCLHAQFIILVTNVKAVFYITCTVMLSLFCVIISHKSLSLFTHNHDSDKAINMIKRNWQMFLWK